MKKLLILISTIIFGMSDQISLMATQLDCWVTIMSDQNSILILHSVKEALHIEKTPANNRLNRDGGYELPGCWITTMKKLEGGGNCASAKCTGAPPSRVG